MSNINVDFLRYYNYIYNTMTTIIFSLKIKNSDIKIRKDNAGVSQEFKKKKGKGSYCRKDKFSIKNVQ
jgi:hypothetical protein